MASAAIASTTNSTSTSTSTSSNSTTCNSNNTSLVLVDQLQRAESRTLLAQAVRCHQQQDYHEAILLLKEILDMEEEIPQVWTLLATVEFEEWTFCACNQHQLAGMEYLTDHSVQVSELLQETYNVFIVTIEYPVNRKNPLLLLQMAFLYVELDSLPSALSICTLLIECYLQFERLADAILLAASIAHCLNKTQDAAGYLQYLMENGPHTQEAGTSACQVIRPHEFLLLAALEFETRHEMRENAKESYAQAYRVMVQHLSQQETAFKETTEPLQQSQQSPAGVIKQSLTLAEQQAMHLYHTSKKSESERIRLWYLDRNTWFELASRLLTCNFPAFALSAIQVIRKRIRKDSVGQQQTSHRKDELLEEELLEAVCHLRLNKVPLALRVLSDCYMRGYDCHPRVRFLLKSSSDEWNTRLNLEETSVRLLQRRLRYFFRRKRWLETFAGIVAKRRNDGALRIQTNWRRHVAQKLAKRLRQERRDREMEETRLMAIQDIFYAVQKANKSSRTIQKAFRKHLQRRKNQHKADRVRAFKRKHLLQELRKVFDAWNQCARELYAQRMASVLMIQRMVRLVVSRKRFLHLKQKQLQREQLVRAALGKRFAKNLRQMFGAWRQVVVDNHEARVHARRVISRFLTKCIARRRVYACVDKRNRIADLMKRWVFGKETRLKWTILHAWNEYLWNCKALRNESAIKIQRVFRGRLGRKRAQLLKQRALRVDRLFAAVQLRRRLWLCSKWFHALYDLVLAKHRLRNTSAVRIQKVFRGFRVRKRYQTRKQTLKLLQSAHMICLSQCDAQQVVRLLFLALVQAVVKSKTARYCAARKIQQWFRHVCNKRKMHSAGTKLLRRREIFTCLMTNFHTIARAFLTELKQTCTARRLVQRTNAITIQRHVRGWLCRKHCVHLRARKLTLASTLQRLDAQRRIKWLTKCFVGWHGFAAEWHSKRRQAATKIQRKVRARQAQKKARCILQKKAAQRIALDTSHTRPMQRCFHKWQSIMIEKSVLIVRSANRTPMTMPQGDVHGESGSATKEELFKRMRPLEERAQVPSILFYTLLNRVRSSGICHLTPRQVATRDQTLVIWFCNVDGVCLDSACCSFDVYQLQQLIQFTTNLISTGWKPHENISERIIDVMHNLTTCPVQKLILYNSCVDASHLTRLSRLLSSPGHCLVSIVLGGTKLSTSGMISIACGLCLGGCKLQQLVLESCDLGNASAAALAEALRRNRSLRKLDLSKNHLTDLCCSVFADALATNEGLKVLCLSENDLTDRGVLSYLAPALQNLASQSSLEQVILRQNRRISALGVEALASACRVVNTTRMGNGRSQSEKTNGERGASPQTVDFASAREIVGEEGSLQVVVSRWS